MEVTKKHKALIKKLTMQMRQMAGDLERKLTEGFEAKKRAFALALAKIERKHAAQLTKSAAGVKSRKVAKKSRSKKK